MGPYKLMENYGRWPLLEGSRSPVAFVWTTDDRPFAPPSVSRYVETGATTPCLGRVARALLDARCRVPGTEAVRPVPSVTHVRAAYA